MSTPFPRSPKLLKGAFVELGNGFIGPVPQVIVFQYNPATLSRTLQIEGETGNRGNRTAPATAQPTPPPETIGLSLELDATDALETPDSHPIAVLAGVADRMAAIELLLHPSVSGSGLLGDLAGSLGLGGLFAQPPERPTVPLTLFIWGPGKIVPVRISQFSVEEQEFSPTLYPIRAKINLSMKILQPGDFPTGIAHAASRGIAEFCYKYYRTQQKALAVANVANTVESILGMLPF